MLLVKIQVIILSILCCLHTGIQAQTVKILQEGQRVSFRGLSVVTDKILWVSGSNGTVGKSVDGGDTWIWVKVAGYEKRDFRDIQAFSDKTAIIMAVAEPAVILKTTDAGETWKKVYENSMSGMFLDAMEFVDKKKGTVIGDPVNGHFFIADTNDGGETWKENSQSTAAETGEACFAASGTNIRLTNNRSYFVTGGAVSRLFIDNKPVNIPLLQGKESQGANSIALNKNKIIIVGGDFMADSLKNGNCIISTDNGNTWITPSVAPNGYRSCVEFISSKELITCGLTGVDISIDGGIYWKPVTSMGFNVCARSKSGNAVYLAGSNGRIGRLQWK